MWSADTFCAFFFASPYAPTYSSCRVRKCGHAQRRRLYTLWIIWGQFFQKLWKKNKVIRWHFPPFPPPSIFWRCWVAVLSTFANWMRQCSSEVCSTFPLHGIGTIDGTDPVWHYHLFWKPFMYHLFFCFGGFSKRLRRYVVSKEE